MYVPILSSIHFLTLLCDANVSLECHWISLGSEQTPPTPLTEIDSLVWHWLTGQCLYLEHRNAINHNLHKCHETITLIISIIAWISADKANIQWALEGWEEPLKKPEQHTTNLSLGWRSHQTEGRQVAPWWSVKTYFGLILSKSGNSVRAGAQRVSGADRGCEER